MTEATETIEYDQPADDQGRENFGLAVIAGIGAAIFGALLWAIVGYVTEMELGLIAIAVGAFVGYAVRVAGHGHDQKFGILGATCAALGWALGTILCDLAFLAKQTGVPFLDVLFRTGLSGSISLGVQAGGEMDFLFLAIAVWEGWKFSTRHR